MKKYLVLILFVLVFSQCTDVGNPTLNLMPGTGQSKNTAAGLSGGGIPGIGEDQPSLTKAPVKPKRKKHRRKKKVQVDRVGNPVLRDGWQADTSLISRLKSLESYGLEPDLNEPGTRKYLFGPHDTLRAPAMITLSRETFLVIDFDNDILDYTDRFYTNGIRIAVISPALQANPVRHLLLPYWRSGINYYGLSLVQNMFTPSTTKMGGILHGDRPYAAYLYLGSFKITNDSRHKFRQSSELDAGIIGPNSYGEWVQRKFHNAVPTNNEPLGWEYQIKNDLVLNYTVAYEKGVVETKILDLQIFTKGKVGTIYTSLAGGAQVRAGWLNPYFANLGIARKKALHEAGLRKVQFFLYLKGSERLVGYDATLQGGLFNKSSVYTIPGKDVSRAVFEGSAGLTLSLNGIRLDVEQFMLSPEFNGGQWHRWVHVGVTFGL